MCILYTNSTMNRWVQKFSIFEANAPKYDSIPGKAPKYDSIPAGIKLDLNQIFYV